MPRYINADALIEMLNKKAETDLEMGLYNHGALTQSFIKFVERQPTADVVPRAEIDKLANRVMMLGEICNSYALQYGTAIDKEIILNQTKQQVAREIFEDIEAVILGHLMGNYDIHDTMDTIRTLKKKYTEGGKTEC